MTATAYDNSILPPPGNSDLSKQGGAGAAEGGLQWSPTNNSHGTTRTSSGRSVRLQDIAEVTSQLSIMTRSGVDVASALGSLANQCRRPALAKVLHDVHEAVLSGNTLSDALKLHSDTFDPSYIATVAAGEASGHMSEVLAQLAQMQRGFIKSRRTMRALMTYPVLLMLVSLAVLVGLVLFVLPRFANVFEQYEVALPALTQALISLADELWMRWWLWGPLVIGSTAGLYIWRSTAQGRRTIDALWLRTPALKNVYRSQQIGRTCRLIGLMLQSGVPLVDTLRLTRQAITNTLYKELLADLEDAVVNGRSLESALPDSEVIPQSAREMIITAETTGKMGDVTKLLGEYYEEEAEADMRQVIGLLEPIITVGMGILVAGVVLAVMMPVFDLSTLAKGGH